MFQIHHLTLTGRGPDNEDALSYGTHPADPSMLLLALADGQGGRPGGGPAARLAVATVLEAAWQQPPDRLLDPRTWPALLQEADRRVKAEAGAGFTTLLAFALTGSTLTGGANGDDALVVVDPRQRRLVTQGLPRNPPIGCGQAAVGTFTTSLTPPWLVVAASDGVWKFTGPDALLDVSPGLDPDLLAQSLHHQARGPVAGLRDDFTLAIVQPDPMG